MKNNNYITIQGWMINLGLKGNELIIFAIIYGFSQDDKSSFNGSQRYISSMLGISLPTTNRIINSLIDKNFIKKTGESSYQYSDQVLKKLKQGVKETYTEALKKLKHTYIYNNNINNCEPSSQRDDKLAIPPKGKDVPYDEKVYLEEMLNNKSRHIQLIAKYFISSKKQFPSKKAIQAEVRRWVKDASIIAEYPDERINKTFLLVSKKFPQDWNLSTIKKYISSV